MSYGKYRKEHHVTAFMTAMEYAQAIDPEHWLPIASVIYGKLARPDVYLRKAYERSLEKEKKIEKHVIRAAKAPFEPPTPKPKTIRVGEPVKSVSASQNLFSPSDTAVNSREPSSSAQTVQEILTKELGDFAKQFEIREGPEYIEIHPRKYLAKFDFAKVAGIVKNQLGGEYVSAGKNSHFRIPRQ